MAHEHEADPACAVAHGDVAPDSDAIAHGFAAAAAVDRTLVAVFASPVAEFLLRFGADLGFRTLLLEPDPDRAGRAAAAVGVAAAEVVAEPPADLDDTADVVVTDHHRPELGVVLRDVLKRRVRWVGVMGSPRHEGPHVRALTELGVPAADIARVHRPIGLNIGSRTPPEIALATLAGLIADRTGSPGGFHF
ncbi:MAG TPA: XdhC family protein [Streptosporangiaceae bacterium]|nr:XdhC family protein [Streptosporangiaceae bacterium]